MPLVAEMQDRFSKYHPLVNFLYFALVLDLLSKPPKRNLKEYADSILSAALKNLSHSDDMTVSVTRVIKTKD